MIGRFEWKIVDYDEEVRRKVLCEWELEVKVRCIEVFEK